MSDTKKQQPPYLTFIIIFILGFAGGIGFAVFKLGTGNGNAPVPAVTQQTDDQAAQTSAAITNLEAEVTANPENFASWVQLGHLYFDTNQPEKAIAAYTTSLKYHSGDANLLTDLGVMYRLTKQPQKAIELFEKAQAMDSQHQPSRYNEGIVRLYDLNDTKGAVAAWEELLTINPDATAGDGQKMREFINQLKSGQNKK